MSFSMEQMFNWGPDMHICVSELGHNSLRQWLVAYSAQSHYFNQFWLIINYTPISMKFYVKSKVSNQENAF